MTEVVGRVGAVVVAAGSGLRFGPGARKQYRTLRGVPILELAVRPFLDHPAIVRTVVVLPIDDISAPPDWLTHLDVIRVAGGEQRGDSVRNGLDALGDVCDVVLVHDGARPLVTRELIDRLLAAAGEEGVIPAIASTDTLKVVAPDGLVESTVDRSRLWRVQTPQLFPLEPLRRAHENARHARISTSDDAALFEREGWPVRVVEGDIRNLKVTTAADLAFAEALAYHLPRPD